MLDYPEAARLAVRCVANKPGWRPGMETNIMHALGMRVLTHGALASTATAPLRSSTTVLATTVCSTPRWI